MAATRPVFNPPPIRISHCWCRVDTANVMSVPNGMQRHIY
jgi:hypothetical protein